MIMIIIIAIIEDLIIIILIVMFIHLAAKTHAEYAKNITSKNAVIRNVGLLLKYRLFKTISFDS